MTEPPVHVSTDEVHAHAHGTGRHKFDLIIAVSAIFISAISLAVGIEHSHTERQLVAASSWPFLREEVSNFHNGGQEAVIGVSNGGVGPAKLKSFEVFYDGQATSSSIDLLRKCCGLGDDKAIKKQLPQGLITSLADDTVLRPGEENLVLTVPRLASAPEVPDRFVAALLKLSFRACYCSVLDECWVSDLRSTQTKAVSQCPIPEHPFDPNSR